MLANLGYWDIGHIFWDIAYLRLGYWDIHEDFGMLVPLGIGILAFWDWDNGPPKLGYWPSKKDIRTPNPLKHHCGWIIPKGWAVSNSKFRLFRMVYLRWDFILGKELTVARLHFLKDPLPLNVTLWTAQGRGCPVANISLLPKCNSMWHIIIKVSFFSLEILCLSLMKNALDFLCKIQWTWSACLNWKCELTTYVRCATGK